MTVVAVITMIMVSHHLSTMTITRTVVVSVAVVSVAVDWEASVAVVSEASGVVDLEALEAASVAVAFPVEGSAAAASVDREASAVSEDLGAALVNLSPFKSIK